MRVFEIFRSIDGEVSGCHQGRFTAFIRFAGCNLKCRYCDIPEAQDINTGKVMSVSEIVKELESVASDLKKVTITGGEPMMQKEIWALTKELSLVGYEVVVETNGTLPLVGYNIKSWVVDFKLPSSGEFGKHEPKAFERLGRNDFVKFVIWDYEDFEASIAVIQQLREGGCRALFAFSPVHEVLSPRMLYDWVERARVGRQAVLNLQLHKYLGLA